MTNMKQEWRGEKKGERKEDIGKRSSIERT